MNVTTTRQATGTYCPSAPGARTLADAKPLYIGVHHRGQARDGGRGHGLDPGRH